MTTKLPISAWGGKESWQKADADVWFNISSEHCS